MFTNGGFIGGDVTLCAVAISQCVNEVYHEPEAADA